MKTLLLLTLFIINACASYKISNFEKYKQTTLAKVENASSINTNNLKKNIVLLPIDVSKSTDARDLDLDSIAKNEILKILSSQKRFNIIDRSTNVKLLEEVKIKEFNEKQVDANLLKDSDYAVNLSIDEATFGSRMNSRFAENIVTNVAIIGTAIATDTRMLPTVSIPPEYVYTSVVSGNLKLIDVASGKNISSHFFSEKGIETEAAGSGGVNVLINISTLKNAKTKDSNLVSNTLKKGVQKAINQTINDIDVETYVVARQDFEGKTIFQINAGLTSDLKKGDKVLFISEKSFTNPITSVVEKSYEKIKIGFVSDKIDDNYSWIVVDKKLQDKYNTLKIGSKISISRS